MKKQDLQNYHSITICRNGTVNIATLRNDIAKGPMAEMPPINVIGTLLSEPISLTDEMIERIVVVPNGTIRLDL